MPQNLAMELAGDLREHHLCRTGSQLGKGREQAVVGGGKGQHSAVPCTVGSYFRFPALYLEMQTYQAS